MSGAGRPARRPGRSRAPASPWPTWAACSRSRTGWRPHSSPRCAIPSCASCTARACAAACCSTDRRGAARRSSPAPSPASSARGFVSVGLADILDMYIGNSERNIAELFRLVRREAPCVLFLDEIDALGPEAQLDPQQRHARRRRPAADRARRRRPGRTRASSCSPRRTSRGTSTRPCGAPAGWTAHCWSCRRTRRPARRSSATTCGTVRWRASTCGGMAKATDGLLRRRHRPRLRDGVRAGVDRELAQRAGRG